MKLRSIPVLILLSALLISGCRDTDVKADNVGTIMAELLFSKLNCAIENRESNILWFDNEKEKLTAASKLSEMEKDTDRNPARAGLCLSSCCLHDR